MPRYTSSLLMATALLSATCVLSRELSQQEAAELIEQGMRMVKEDEKKEDEKKEDDKKKEEEEEKKPAGGAKDGPGGKKDDEQDAAAMQSAENAGVISYPVTTAATLVLASVGAMIF